MLPPFILIVLLPLLGWLKHTLFYPDPDAISLFKDEFFIAMGVLSFLVFYGYLFLFWLSGGGIFHRQQELYKAAGLRIPHNALRHSYGSHHLVLFDNPANTATEMGHYSPQQTFAAYRQAVLKSQAAKFWNIHKVWDLSKAGGTLGNGASTGRPLPRKNKAQ